MRTWLSIPLCIVLLACSSSPPTTQVPPPPVPATAPEPKPTFPLQLESFDYTWKVIADTHWDLERVGARWQAARDELRPVVIAAKSEDEARAAIRELLRRLGQTHFGLSSPAPSRGPATIAARLRLVGDELVIISVDERAEKDLRPGLAIVALDGVVVADELATARAKVEKNSPTHDYEILGAVSAALQGPEGSVGTIEAVTPSGERKEFDVTRHLPAGKLVTFGNLANIPVEYESRWLDKKTAYVRLSVFIDPTMVSENFQADVAKFSKASGLVLDLRGNPGGLGGMASGIIGRLITKSAVIGTTITRDGRVDDIANPQPGAFPGKVAVLIDEMCASTCEILAAGLVQIGRAQLFGTTTAGAALPSVIAVLPSGDVLQYAIANYVNPSGVALEGAGVEPTVRVEIDKKSLFAGKDTQLQAAIAWIAQKESK